MTTARAFSLTGFLLGGGPPHSSARPFSSAPPFIPEILRFRVALRVPIGSFSSAEQKVEVRIGKPSIYPDLLIGAVGLALHEVSKV